MTLITQLFPASTVLALPQDPVTTFWKKSPLIAMVLMFNVAFPVFVSVTVFTEAFLPTRTLPHVSEVGASLTFAPLIMRVKVVVCVKLPDVPVIVTVLVAAPAEGLTVSVSALVEVVGFGVNPAVTPLGRPEAAKLTLPVKPLAGTTAIVLVPLLPGGMLSLLGVAVRLKSGPTTMRLNVVV